MATIFSQKIPLLGELVQAGEHMAFATIMCRGQVPPRVRSVTGVSKDSAVDQTWVYLAPTELLSGKVQKNDPFCSDKHI
jgi:hypothetical protein